MIGNKCSVFFTAVSWLHLNMHLTVLINWEIRMDSLARFFPEIGPQFPTSDAKVFHVDEAKIWLLWQLDRFAGDMLTASPGHPSYYIAGALSNIQWSFTHSIGTSILHSTVVKETTLLSPCFILLGPPSHRWTHNAWCLCLFMTYFAIEWK